MNREDLLAIFDREQRIELTQPGIERQVVGSVIRTVNHPDRLGFIQYSKLAEEEVEVQIEAQLAYFQSLGYEMEWKVYDHDTPPDLRERLAACGFTMEEPEALMVLDTEEAPAFFQSVDTSAVRQLRDPAEIAGIVAMEDEVWGHAHTRLGSWLARNLREHPEQVSIYVVPADGRIVSAAWVYFHPPTRFASLWGGSTLPAYRKRGYTRRCWWQGPVKPRRVVSASCMSMPLR